MINNVPDDLQKIHRGKRNKPPESKFCQQRLSAWRPLLTARCIYPIFMLVGAAFICLGVLLHLGAKKASEVSIDYTDCKTTNGTKALSLLDITKKQGPICEYHIILNQGFEGDVVFFYGLSNFYQNLRQYIASRNDQQLFGDLESVENCAPYEKDETSGLKIAPCGSVANSMFNDTFSMTYSMENGTTVNVPFAAGNVIHSYERERKYKNPPYDPALNETLCDAFNKTTQPPWWQTPICEVGNDETGRGFENVDFIVWMNTAPLPDFRKIYRTLNRTQPDDSTFHIGLPAGNYTLRIRYNYGVAQFNIKKYFVIATTSWSGPKNFFLGIAYMTVGLFLFLLGCGLIVYECINRKMNVMADSAPQVTNDAEREPDALEHSEQILTPKRRSPTPERKSCKRPKKSILSGARAEIPHKRRSKQPVESGQHATDPSELNETCEVHELTDNVEPTPKSTRRKQQSPIKNMDSTLNKKEYTLTLEPPTERFNQTFDCYQNVLLPSQMPEFEKNHINNIAKIVFPSALRNVKENDKAHGSNGKSSMVDHLPEDVRKLVDAERNAAIAASSCAIPLPGQEFVTRLFMLRDVLGLPRNEQHTSTMLQSDVTVEHFPSLEPNITSDTSTSPQDLPEDPTNLLSVSPKEKAERSSSISEDESILNATATEQVLTVDKQIQQQNTNMVSSSGNLQGGIFGPSSTGTVQNALFPPQNAAGLLNMFNAFRNGSAHMRWLQYMMATGNPQPVAVPAGESALFPNCINCLSSPATSASQKTSAFPFREQQKYVFKCSFCKETIFNLKPGLYEIRQHVANHHGLFISCIFKKCTIRSQLREFGGHIHKVHGKKTAELKGDEALLYQAKRDVFKYDTNVLLLRYMDMPPNSVRNMDLLPPTEAKRALAQTAL